MRNQVDRLGLNSKIGFFVTGLVVILILIGTTLGFTQEKALTGRPDWTRLTAFQKDVHVYFTGGFLNGADYPLSLRCANAEALKVAAQSIWDASIQCAAFRIWAVLCKPVGDQPEHFA